MPETPHYLLFSEASCPQTGQSWRFVIQDVETSRRMVVSDNEPAACGERLELLAVVRGLEALDGPARVTLVTRSRYVSRGIRSGITEWRANDWQWERFGRIVPVKDCDLWQRIDRALLFHQVDCQAWQFESAAPDEPLDCRPEVSPVEAVGTRCSEFTPKPCELATPPDHGHLAPTKRPTPVRRQAAARSRKRRLVPAREGSSLSSLAAAVVSKAAIWGESLRGFGHPLRPSIQGAA